MEENVKVKKRALRQHFPSTASRQPNASSSTEPNKPNAKNLSRNRLYGNKAAREPTNVKQTKTDNVGLKKRKLEDLLEPDGQDLHSRISTKSQSESTQRESANSADFVKQADRRVDSEPHRRAEGVANIPKPKDNRKPGDAAILPLTNGRQGKGAAQASTSIARLVSKLSKLSKRRKGVMLTPQQRVRLLKRTASVHVDHIVQKTGWDWAGKGRDAVARNAFAASHASAPVGHGTFSTNAIKPNAATTKLNGASAHRGAARTRDLASTAVRQDSVRHDTAVATRVGDATNSAGVKLPRNTAPPKQEMANAFELGNLAQYVKYQKLLFLNDVVKVHPYVTSNTTVKVLNGYLDTWFHGAWQQDEDNRHKKGVRPALQTQQISSKQKAVHKIAGQGAQAPFPDGSKNAPYSIDDEEEETKALPSGPRSQHFSRQDMTNDALYRRFASSFGTPVDDEPDAYKAAEKFVISVHGKSNTDLFRERVQREMVTQERNSLIDHQKVMMPIAVHNAEVAHLKAEITRLKQENSRLTRENVWLNIPLFVPGKPYEKQEVPDWHNMYPPEDDEGGDEADAEEAQEKEQVTKGMGDRDEEEAPADDEEERGDYDDVQVQNDQEDGDDSGDFVDD